MEEHFQQATRLYVLHTERQVAGAMQGQLATGDSKTQGNSTDRKAGIPLSHLQKE